ncbi:MAG: hypothetical protein ACOCZ8_02835 [Bacteroidota bacterium]
MRKLALSFVSTLFFSLFFLPGFGQQVRFAETFSPQGELLNIDSVIAWMPPEKIIAVQYSPRRGIDTDTLHVIVRDFYGTVGRYYMKRTKDGLRGNALVRIKGDGIYRVYVYDPKSRRQPLAYGRLYILSTQFMTIRSLVEHQRKLLLAKGQLPSQRPKPTPQPPDNTRTTGDKTPDRQPEPSDSPVTTEAPTTNDTAEAQDSTASGDELDMGADDFFDDFDDDFSDFDSLDETDTVGKEDIMSDFGEIEDAAVGSDVDDMMGDDFDDFDMMDEDFESFDDLDDDFDFEIDDF